MTTTGLYGNFNMEPEVRIGAPLIREALKEIVDQLDASAALQGRALAWRSMTVVPEGDSLKVFVPWLAVQV